MMTIYVVLRSNVHADRCVFTRRSPWEDTFPVNALRRK